MQVKFMICYRPWSARCKLAVYVYTVYAPCQRVHACRVHAVYGRAAVLLVAGDWFRAGPDLVTCAMHGTGRSRQMR